MEGALLLAVILGVLAFAAAFPHRQRSPPFGFLLDRGLEVLFLICPLVFFLFLEARTRGVSGLGRFLEW